MGRMTSSSAHDRINHNSTTCVRLSLLLTLLLWPCTLSLGWRTLRTTHRVPKLSPNGWILPLDVQKRHDYGTTYFPRLMCAVHECYSKPHNECSPVFVESAIQQNPSLDTTQLLYTLTQMARYELNCDIIIMLRNIFSLSSAEGLMLVDSLMRVAADIGNADFVELLLQFYEAHTVKPSEKVWDMALLAFSKKKVHDRALQMLHSLRREGLHPSHDSLRELLLALAEAGQTKVIREILLEMEIVEELPPSADLWAYLAIPAVNSGDSASVLVVAEQLRGLPTPPTSSFFEYILQQYLRSKQAKHGIGVVQAILSEFPDCLDPLVLKTMLHISILGGHETMATSIAQKLDQYRDKSDWCIDLAERVVPGSFMPNSATVLLNVLTSSSLVQDTTDVVKALIQLDAADEAKKLVLGLGKITLDEVDALMSYYSQNGSITELEELARITTSSRKADYTISKHKCLALLACGKTDEARSLFRNSLLTFLATDLVLLAKGFSKACEWSDALLACERILEDPTAHVDPAIPAVYVRSQFHVHGPATLMSSFDVLRRNSIDSDAWEVMVTHVQDLQLAFTVIREAILANTTLNTSVLEPLLLDMANQGFLPSLLDILLQNKDNVRWRQHQLVLAVGKLLAEAGEYSQVSRIVEATFEAWCSTETVDELWLRSLVNGHSIEGAMQALTQLRSQRGRVSRNMWNVLLQADCPQQTTLSLLEEMREVDHLELDSQCLTMILEKYRRCKDLRSGISFLEMIRSHASPMVFTEEALAPLISLAASLDSLDTTALLLNYMSTNNISASDFTLRIFVLENLQVGNEYTAFRMLSHWIRSNHVDFAPTFSDMMAVMAEFAKTGKSSQVDSLLKFMEPLAMSQDVAEVDRMYEQAIFAHAAANHSKRAVELLERKRSVGLKPSPEAYACTLKILARRGNSDQCRALFDQMQFADHLQPRPEHWLYLLTAYGNRRRVHEAMQMLDAMKQLDVSFEPAMFEEVVQVFASNGEVGVVKKLISGTSLSKTSRAALLIEAYFAQGNVGAAKRVIFNAQQAGLLTTEPIWRVVLMGLSNAKLVGDVEEYLLKIRGQNETVFWNLRYIYVRACVRCGSFDSAKKTLDELESQGRKDVNAWMQYIIGLRSVGDEEGLTRAVAEMFALYNRDSLAAHSQLVEFYTGRSQLQKAYDVLKHMKRAGMLLSPTLGILTHVFDRCDGFIDPEFAREYAWHQYSSQNLRGPEYRRRGA